MPRVVVFRVDASLDIGTGHVMRCLTVASALRGAGATCYFICRDLPGNLIAAIVAQGYQVQTLPAPAGVPVAGVVPHAVWLGVDWSVDADQVDAAIAALSIDGPVDWLIVDHYALNARWETALRHRFRRLLVIDDLADREHTCAALIDQNIGRRPEDYANLVNGDCRLMTGTRHALLRPEFAALRDASLARRASAPVRELLVSLGGVDKDDATGVVLDGLATCDLPPDLAITVVMGQQAPWLDKVRAQAQQLPWPTKVAINVVDMASLMASADIAIGAAGTTTWERCCVGLPSLIIGTAENQRYVLSQLKAGDVGVLGDFEQFRAAPEALAALMARLIDQRRGYSERAAALTDGRGCATLVEFLLD